MANPNELPDSSVTTAESHPQNFIDLFSHLLDDGWRQGDTPSKGAGHRYGTIEIQSMILEKDCKSTISEIKGVQLVMENKDEKVICHMYTKPLISTLQRTSTKDMDHLGELMAEIKDYMQLITGNNNIGKIQDGAHKEAMKTTRRLIRNPNGGFRLAADTTTAGDEDDDSEELA